MAAAAMLVLLLAGSSAAAWAAAAADSSRTPTRTPAASDSSQARRWVAADSLTRAAADSAGVVEWPRPRPGETPARRSAAPLTGFDQPRWVMLRSLVFPGWGQLHNRAWLKAIGIAALEGSMIAGLVSDERELSRIQGRIDTAVDEDTYFQAVDAYNARLDKSIARRWWLGAVVVYAVADAYVDAYFVRFKTEFERDPALPEGQHTSVLRLSLGRTF